jgi:hypothetical protein
MTLYDWGLCLDLHGEYLGNVSPNDNLGAPQLEALVLNHDLADSAHIVAPESILFGCLFNRLGQRKAVQCRSARNNPSVRRGWWVCYLPAPRGRPRGDFLPRFVSFEDDGHKTMVRTFKVGRCWSWDGWDSHVDFAQLGSDATAWIIPSSVGVIAHTMWNSMAQGITNPSL